MNAANDTLTRSLYWTYISDINLFDACPTPEEQLGLLRRIKAGDQDALEKFVTANLGLVVHIAKRYACTDFSLLDCISEGNIALMKSARCFDLSFGVQFSSYSYTAIERAIMRAKDNQSRTIRLPIHVVSLRRKLFAFIRTYKGRYGVEPSIQLLAEHIGTSEDIVRDYLDAPVFPCALHDPVDWHNTSPTYEEKISLESENESQFAKILRDRVHDLPKFIKLLSRQEYVVVNRRFGLGGRPDETLEEVGKRFHITRERVRQIENRALRKLRNWLTASEDPDSLASMFNKIQPVS